MSHGVAEHKTDGYKNFEFIYSVLKTVLMYYLLI